MGIERAETPRGSTPDQASGHPSFGLSIPTLFGEPGPPHLEMSQATLRKWNFISINIGVTPIQG